MTLQPVASLSRVKHSTTALPFVAIVEYRRTDCADDRLISVFLVRDISKRGPYNVKLLCLCHKYQHDYLESIVEPLTKLFRLLAIKDENFSLAAKTFQNNHSIMVLK